MSDKLFHTKGIVLRTVRYGETSVVVLIFTELFGIQSYLVNGVRTSSRKSSGKAMLFQPAAILDLVVYHNELKQLQRIKEFNWSVIFHSVLTDVVKNAVAVFMIELLTRSLKQPESNPELFHFSEDALLHLDTANEAVTANLPIFFSLHLPVFFGLRINDNYTELTPILDLQEGAFVNERPGHPHFLEDKQAYIVSQILRVQQTHELEDIKLNKEFRRHLLQALESYYILHIQDFGVMKTLPVLKELLG